MFSHVKHFTADSNKDLPVSLTLKSDSKVQSTLVSRRVSFRLISPATYRSLKGKCSVRLRDSLISTQTRCRSTESMNTQFENDHANAPTIHFFVVVALRPGVRHFGGSVCASAACRLRAQPV